MATFFNLLTHAVIITGLLGLAFLIGSAIRSTAEFSEKVILVAATMTGFLIYFGSRAMGIAIPTLLLPAISDPNPYKVGLIGLLIPGATGAFVAWHGLRCLHKGTAIFWRLLLRTLPIDGLHIARTRIEDLSALRGMALKTIVSDSADIKDLSPLLEMPRLEAAIIPQSASNVEILRQHPTLKYLGWEGDFDGQARRSRSTVADFWECYDAQLDAVKLRAKLSDAGWKRFIVRVRSDGMTYEVRAEGCGITDLSPLAGGPVSALYVGANPITSLEPLRGMPLEKLDLNKRTEINDFRILGKIPGLTWIELYGTSLSDLRDLADLRIRYLHIAYTQVCDLSPLKGTPLEDICLKGAEVTNVGPLLDCPNLKHVQLSEAVTNVEVLRHHSSVTHISYDWDRQNGHPAQTAEGFWAEYDAKHPFATSPAEPVGSGE